MANGVAGPIFPIRMDQFTLIDIGAGTVLENSATLYRIDEGNGFVARLTGTGLTYDAAGRLTGGTLTGFGETFMGSATFTISGTSVRATDYAGWVRTNDVAAALDSTFGGNDSITGGAYDDYLVGLAGNDILTGGSGGNDFILGGLGADSIVGTGGNDHLYGAGPTALSGDGADTIVAGAGNDYLQGNAGADSLMGGIGSDRIYGGQGDDTIFGEDGNDTVNGNLGNDVIDGGAGNDFLRGGQGNDRISGGAGNDQLLGDLGSDTLAGGAGPDILTGGAGGDTFVFGATDAAPGSGALAGYYDTITDYQPGQDRIDLAFSVMAGDYLAAAGISASVTTAQMLAQQLLDGHAGTTDIAAVAVGGDTYLFFNGAGTGGTIDSIVRLAAITPGTLSAADFI